MPDSVAGRRDPLVTGLATLAVLRASEAAGRTVCDLRHDNFTGTGISGFEGACGLRARESDSVRKGRAPGPGRSHDPGLDVARQLRAWMGWTGRCGAAWQHGAPHAKAPLALPAPPQGLQAPDWPLLGPPAPRRLGACRIWFNLAERSASAARRAAQPAPLKFPRRASPQEEPEDEPPPFAEWLRRGGQTDSDGRPDSPPASRDSRRASPASRRARAACQRRSGLARRRSRLQSQHGPDPRAGGAQMHHYAHS